MNRKYINEHSDGIPEDVANKARNLGCKIPKYIYKDREYGNKYPASSMEGDKATRFRNAANAEAHK